MLGTFCGRKLRQTPPVVGTCRVGEAFWVDEIVEAAFRLLRAISFHGVSQVEFKRDQRDGRFKLMEINPRYSIRDHVDRLPFKDPADAEKIVDGVRKAGLLN